MPVIIDGNTENNMIGKNILSELKRCFPNETVVLSRTLKNIGGSTASHPDMQIFSPCGGTAICAPECLSYYRENLSGFGISVIAGEYTPSDTYPNDIAYNAARVGDHIVANLKYLEPKIREHCSADKTISLVDTKQGYAKCSLCIFGDVIITEDEGLYRTVSRLDNIRAYKIPRAGVLLDGYEYGFIGGASGFIDGVAVFAGTPTKEIKEILRENNIEYTALSGGRLHDIGSILTFN